MSKKWRLEKTIWGNGDIEWSIRDLEHGFLADTSINKWMMIDIVETCGGIDKIEFDSVESEKEIRLLLERHMV